MNAFPLLVVASWWLRRVYLWLPEVNPRWPRNLYAAAVALLVATFLLTVNDARNPTKYAGKAFWAYPSVLKKALTWRPRGSAGNPFGEVMAQDVALIASLTREGEQVALIHPLDWAYLIESRRAPRFQFLPSTSAFLDWQIDRSLEGAPLIFVQKRLLAGGMIKSHAERILPLLEQDYDRCREGRDLVAFRRKS